MLLRTIIGVGFLCTGPSFKHLEVPKTPAWTLFSVSRLFNLIGPKIDFSNYSCFLECETVKIWQENDVAWAPLLFFPYLGSKLWCHLFDSKVCFHSLNCSIDNYVLWYSSLLLILSVEEVRFRPLPAQRHTL